MDRTVVITGAGAGLGRTVARTFGDEGADLVLGVREATSVASTAEELDQVPGEVIALRADARDEFDLERLMETAAREAGPIDVLVPAQWTVHDTAGETPVQTLSYSAFDDALRSNVRGAFAAIREATPHLGSEASVLLPIPARGRLEAQSRAGIVAAAGRRGLLDVATVDIEGSVVGIEYEPTRDGDRDPEPDDAASLDRVARGFLAAVPAADALSGSAVTVAELLDGE